MLKVSNDQNCTRIKAISSLVIGELRRDKTLLEAALELVKSELLEFEDEVLARLHLAISRLYRDSDPELALHHIGKLPDESKLPPYLALKYKIELAHIKKSASLFRSALAMAEEEHDPEGLIVLGLKADLASVLLRTNEDEALELVETILVTLPML